MGELRFDGRVAVITGAGRGLGRAYAELLASRGARVLVNDNGASVSGAGTGEDPASEAVAAISAAGGEAVADANSVATSAGGRAIVEHALDLWGRIDVLVNNAGAAHLAASPADITDEGLEITMRTHLFGCFHTIRPAWPRMVEQGYGRICNISSSTALGVENSWDYPAAKAGVLGLTRSLAPRRTGLLLRRAGLSGSWQPQHRGRSRQLGADHRRIRDGRRARLAR